MTSEGENLSITVTLSTVEDLDAICKLLSSCGLPVDGVNENLSRFLVARSSRLEGVVGMERDGQAVLLRSLAVREDSRGKGVGRMLMDRVLQQIRAQGGREVYLLTNTAEKYLARWGFVKIKRCEIPERLLQSSALGHLCPVSSTCMKL